MANPIQFETRTKAGRPDCLHCEELLADAVDDLLSPADRTFFDLHVTTCPDCSASLADAVRGAAWLELLNAPRPEPSADLIERILQQTSGQANAFSLSQAQNMFPGAQTAFEPLLRYPAVPPTQPDTLLTFRPRATAGTSAWNRMRRLAFEPRLAMTAAMAFFSIALTMNITGVRLDQLHPSDLSPNNLRHSFYSVSAAAARHYDSLRVVHVLESRVEDLRELNGEDSTTPRDHSYRKTAPESDRQPASKPAAGPDHKAAPRPEKQEQPNDDHGISLLAPIAPAPEPSRKANAATAANHEGGLA